MSHYHRNKQDLSAQQWSNDYPTLSNLVKNSTSGASSELPDVLKGSVDSFATRYATFLSLSNIEGKIQDSIRFYTDFIVECTRFIKTLITQDQIAPPCQVELMIIPKKVVKVEEEDSDDSDTDSDPDSEDDSVEEESDSEEGGFGVSDDIDPFEALPDLNAHFKKLKLPHEHHVLNGDHCPPRTFYNLLKQLKAIPNAITPRSPSSKKISELNRFDYPHKQRLSIVVDRRKDDTEIFMFEPDPCNEFPRDHVYEW
eukprot:CAMPEP_0201571278 /NCGR_PEP_ID=MMETSP0190_2-20130828/13962_1 /ASSEMBLY_ACC=CAM_ASM_000263 /TAXON_ID=37353 /ORGANISM="Rosalina sp." /LENGTH=254 /DNA_ID=CAMNT_0047995737 /DNA_START=288 /DNA_END=1049 /DNA_ORIENTATION=+